MTSVSTPTFSPTAVADLRTRFDAALAALKGGRHEEALSLAEPLLATAAASPDLQHLLALITAALEDDVAAERYFREALRLDPAYVVSIEQYSRFLITRGRAEEAAALTGAGPARSNPVVLNQHASALTALATAATRRSRPCGKPRGLCPPARSPPTITPCISAKSNATWKPKRRRAGP